MSSTSPWGALLCAADRAVVERAFAADPALRREAGGLVTELSAHELDHVFALAFARELAAAPHEPPAGAVAPAIAEVVDEAHVRGNRRALQRLKERLPR